MTCTLPADALPQRLSGWQQLLRRATSREPIADGVAVTFPSDPGLATDLIALASSEQRCCSFFTFTVRIHEALRLEVTAPSEAGPVVEGLFGVASDAAAG